MTEKQKAQHDSEYKNLLALFITLLTSFKTEGREEALYALAELRTEYAFNYVLAGLGIDFDEAMMLLQNTNDSNLTQHDKDIRDRLLAAIRNLIDFSVCEEYQLYDEVSESISDDDEIDPNSDDYEDLLALCSKYNDTYAAVENSDIEYAGVIAAKWLKYAASEYLVYWTQNDTHVRPWHMALQGYAAPAEEFPSWMIPPIEYNCRCFLLPLEVSSPYDKLSAIKNSAKKIEKPKEINDVYSESLAKCGRIFGPTHSYFTVKEADKDMLRGFVERLREKYHG